MWSTVHLARLKALVVIVGFAAISACVPKIGDKCRSSGECDRDQVCDTTITGGYCTIFDCEENSCPNDAVCVDFGDTTACMRRCDGNRGCPDRRDNVNIVCRDDIGPVNFCGVDPDDPFDAP